jgi:NADPH-dependent ferric siderophore reductase
MNERRTQHRPPQEAPVRRTVPVVRVEQLTPHVRRITFGGPELSGFSIGGPAEHMKVFFPKSGEERPVLPTWIGCPPEGAERPISRTYTPRRWRPDALELDIDFVTHGDGPGSTWARNAEPGRFAAVSSPKSAYAIDPPVSRYIIAGDDAAVPAIGTILEALPAHARAEVYLEVDDAGEQQQLDSAAATDIVWLHRGAGHEAASGLLIEQTLRALPLPDAETHIFVACEASVMRDIRRYLLNERGLGRSQVYTHGYWKLGEANHPDGDRGQEI